MTLRDRWWPVVTDGGTKSGTFLVSTADEGSAVLSAVEDGQVCPLASNPGFEVGEIVEATLAPEGPLEVTWRTVMVVERWTPGERARSVAARREAGQLVQVGIEAGELHVFVVETGRTEAAIEDVVADETTRRVAARLGARSVEVRGAEGVVGVRCLQ